MTDKFFDLEYFNLIDQVYDLGHEKFNKRTQQSVQSAFGLQMRFDLSEGHIPLLTSKKMFTRGAIIELLWYLKGTGNITELKEQNVHIWDQWANENNDLGPVYGVMWRRWPSIVRDEETGAVTIGELDQLQRVIDTLRIDPTDRRLIVTAWNPDLLPDNSVSFAENVANGKQALPPCHFTFELYTRPLTTDESAANGGKQYELSLKLHQRSCDVLLGVPFNIVQYSMLLHMICHVVNMTPGAFVWSGGDVHIYDNHREALNIQRSRPIIYPSPTLRFARKIDNINDFLPSDFIIEGYQSHGPLPKVEVAI